MDTRQKNLNVTKRIIESIIGSRVENISVLQSVEKYDTAIKKAANWRELYIQEYGLSPEQTDQAGKLWAEYQLKDRTPTPFYDGITEVVKRLQNIPSGIVSQNAQSNILKVLETNDLLDYFGHVVGYEELDFSKQKPAPDGVLICLEKITPLNSGIVFYVGDHEVDTKCAFHANQLFRENRLDSKVLSIGAFYGSEHDDSDWTIKPDYRANIPQDIINVIQGF